MGVPCPTKILDLSHDTFEAKKNAGMQQKRVKGLQKTVRVIHKIMEMKYWFSFHVLESNFLEVLIVFLCSTMKAIMQCYPKQGIKCKKSNQCFLYIHLLGSV